MTSVDLAKIKNLRKQIKLTQTEVAKKLELSSGKLYHDRESGRVEFSADEVARLSIVLGVAVETLYSEKIFNRKITQNVMFGTKRKKGA